MTTAQWTRFGLVAAALLGALAGLPWTVGESSVRPLAWVGGGAAVLVLATTLTARVRRPTTAETTAVGTSAGAPNSAPVPSAPGPTDNAVAGGVTGGTVLQGRDFTVHQPTHHTVIDTQIVHSPAAEPDWPVVVGVLPNEADHFQHRELTDRLDHTAKDHPTVVLGQVLSGMGGVGKTQLAAHHTRALLAKDAVDLVVWVPAAERSTIVQAYADAARAVCGGHVDEDPDRAALRFLTWLQSTERRWLVVLDNLDVPEHVRGLWPPTAAPAAAGGSAAGSPSGPLGRLVVTTRRTDTALAGRGRAFIDVGTYTPDEAHTYLATALADLPGTGDGAELTALAEDLGHLPLALSHAAAYVRDRRDSMTCASYRARLRDRRGVLERMFPERESLPDDYARTVATTWSMSVEHADTLTPRGLALPMMRLLSLLDPTGVPVIALTCPPVLEYLRRARPDRPEPTEQDADDALSALARLHLVTRSGSGDDAVVGVHRLVQRATREQRATRPDRDTARTAADALMRVWPMRVHASALGQRLRANTAALVEHAMEWLWEDGLHPVIARFGESLGKSGALSQAVDHWTSVLDTAGARLGGDHRDTLYTRHQVILWRGMAGEANYAAEAFAALAEETAGVLGAEDSQTMATRVQSARWLGRAGGEQRARRMMEDILPDLLRLLGPDHPDTLTTRGHLASLRGKAGEARAAVDTYSALLEDEHRMLGHEHPRVLLTRSMLARWRGHAEEAAAAIADFEALLPDQVRVLGPDHPDTLSTRGQIAAWRGVAGDHDRALRELDALRADQLRHLGPDHPHLLTTRHSQARFLGEAGDPALAAELIADLMPDQLRILGPDHPKTQRIQADLEHWRAKAREEPGA